MDLFLILERKGKCLNYGWAILKIKFCDYIVLSKGDLQLLQILQLLIDTVYDSKNRLIF